MFIPLNLSQRLIINPDISCHYHLQLDAKLYPKRFAKVPFTRCNATLSYLRPDPLLEIPCYRFPSNPNIPLIFIF